MSMLNVEPASKLLNSVDIWLSTDGVDVMLNECSLARLTTKILHQQSLASTTHSVHYWLVMYAVLRPNARNYSRASLLLVISFYCNRNAVQCSSVVR